MRDTDRGQVLHVFAALFFILVAEPAGAGEIGTTPEGNIIYQFNCPPAGSHAEIHSPSVDWDNHLKNSDGLEWDVDHGSSGFPFSPTIRPLRISRSGQVLTCTFEAKWTGYDRKVQYQYKVKRDIVQCTSTGSSTMRCILKPGADDGKGPSSSSSSSAEPSEPSPACCLTTVNSELKGRLGRLVVAFPEKTLLKGTSVTVLKEGKSVFSGYGNQTWELLPGTYEIRISNKSVPNVIVQPGHDTQVKAGALRIAAGKGTRAAVLHDGKELLNGYGEQVIGLPPGSFEVQIAGQTQKVTISEGKITDF